MPSHPQSASPVAHSYACGTSARPLIGQTIGDYLDSIVDRLPDHPSLIVPHQGIRLSYSEFQGAVDRCARGLLAAGIRRGDRVGIWAPNRAEWVTLQFATAKIGAILVTINPAYRSHELEYAIRQSGLRMLVFAPRVRRTDNQTLLATILPELEKLAPRPDRVASDRFPDLEFVVSLDDLGAPGVWSWNELCGRAGECAADLLRRAQAPLQFDDAINIQYTSGTTGLPKGATLSHHNILNNGFLVGERMEFSPADRLCIPVPLYHCFGMVLGNLACVAHGATMVYPAETFDARATLEAVQAERCTALHGVPTMFIAELGLPEFDTFDLSSLRTGIMAGSSCPIELMRRVQGRMNMREIEIGYGMTETSPVSFQSAVDDPVELRVTTVGRILPHTECKVIDPATGAVVPEGTTGELCTRGYCVMIGYWRDPEATARAIDASGWMHSGDLATMRNGYVNIVGRIKDMIIRGGENISPREIEELLHTHPDIDDAYIIGVPSRRYGEEIMAWVRVRPGAELGAEAVQNFCRERISHFKVPRYVKFVDTFPMTVTGKIQKFVMRQVACEELDLVGEIEETA
jgi:fatty-acyl-CoA synthase